jgi:ElaB/YqjD/DUF883 family membrane-anchored ribosome-binding protein
MNRTTIDEQQSASEEEATRRRGRRRAGIEGAGGDGEGEPRMLDMARLREVGRNLGAQVEEQVHTRPYVIIGAAAGIGFVAGSLFGSRLGQLLLACGLGYLAKNILDGEIGVERLEQGLEKLTGEAGVG